RAGDGSHRLNHQLITTPPPTHPGKPPPTCDCPLRPAGSVAMIIGEPPPSWWGRSARVESSPATRSTMWIPKWQRDHHSGIDSPIRTQGVSKEEFLPRPQSKQQRQWETLIGELAEEKSRKLGMPRRDFLRTSMGMATAFLASNLVYGKYWDVDEAETLDAAATEEKFPKGEYFIVDVQTHFTDGVALGFRNAEFVRNMGFQLKNNADAYSFTNYVKEIFFDSETSMAVISGVPGREINKSLAGKILEGRDRRGGILPSWLMSQRKKELNELAGGTRAF